MPPSEAAASIPATARVYRYDAGMIGPVLTREIAVETPIEIAFGGAPFAVMMATPCDIEDFAIGFALTEGIIEAIEDIRAIEAAIDATSGRINVTLSGERMGSHLARKRAMSGRTGCGLCGIEDLEHLPKARRRLTPSRPIAPEAIGAAVAGLASVQPLNAQTRAVHAAAWCGCDGAIRVAREDVGRHNALDKTIGALTRAQADFGNGYMLITSRASYEMVQKAATVGISLLVAVSAPTAFAVRLAKRSGLTLVAFARADRHVVYAHPHRVRE